MNNPIYNRTIDEIRTSFNKATLQPEEIDYATGLLMDVASIIDIINDFYINHGENKTQEMLFMVRVAMKKDKERKNEPKL